MSIITQAVIQIISLFTVIGDAVVITAVSVFVLEKIFRISFPISSFLRSFIAKWALLLAFIIALTATVVSLYFSDVVGYEPCKLCWIQRIFMYPQVFLLGMALWWKDERVAKYIILLSGLGAVVAGYHYYLQLGGVPLIPCPSTAAAVSCSQRFILTFGYITIPIMTFTAFALNIIIMKTIKKPK